MEKVGCPSERAPEPPEPGAAPINVMLHRTARLLFILGLSKHRGKFELYLHKLVDEQIHFNLPKFKTS